MKKIESVLLVEDDDVTNFISKRILEGSGITQIDIALNGEEGIEELKKHCPDIVLLDINMPLMNGFEFLEARKDIQLCSTTRVVMLTSSGRPEDKEKACCYESVIGYIEKPLTAEKLEQIEAN